MRLPDRLDFNCPLKVLCGQRALEHLPYELATRNARKPLLLSDEAAFRENRTQVLAHALRESGMVMGVVESLPTDGGLDLVHELAAIYRDRDHDALMVLGAGPLMDLAKLLNLVVSTGQDDPSVFSGEIRIEQRLKPMALIAPAAASGYEASGRVQADQIDRRSIHLMPDLTAVDERTVGSPERDAVIESALAALVFGAEAMLDSDHNPMVDIYAANAVLMAMAALTSADQLPDAMELRLHAANAAVMAGCTLADKAPGKLHRLGCCLAATGRVSLPGALGILLPAAVGYGAQNWGWTPADLLTALVGFDRSASAPPRQRPLLAAASLMALMNDLFNHTEGRIPRTLRDAGFNTEDLASIADSFADTAEVADHDAARAILGSALDGEPVPFDP